MSAETVKVGIISCSGEEIPGGAISRLATRRVLELLRPNNTVTICLPLFLAGNEAEQDFARTHPTITVDGCDKRCAKWGTEQHSGPVNAALVVEDVIGADRLSKCHRSARNLNADDEEAVRILAKRIVEDVDAILAMENGAAIENVSPKDGVCSCSSPIPASVLIIDGERVEIPGLMLIFEQCMKNGVTMDAEGAKELLRTVRVYHPIDADKEPNYREALMHAYRDYFRSHQFVPLNSIR